MNMKKITLLLIMATSLLSFKQQPQLWADGPINKTAYDIRLTFIQDRCRMLEEMFEEQYKEGELNAQFAFFYIKMVRTMDSSAADLKHFKVLFK